MVIMLGAVLMWVLNSGTQSHALWRIMLPGFVVFTGVGFIRPTASAGALTQAPRELTGPASALFSFWPSSVVRCFRSWGNTPVPV